MEKKLPKLLSDLVAQCCLGRTDAELAKLLTQPKIIEQFDVPSGIKVIRLAADIRVMANETCNCCNGRIDEAFTFDWLIGML